MNVFKEDKINVRYPAEWEPQETIWLTWPENTKEWGDRLDNIRKFYIKLISTILPYQSVSLIIRKASFESNDLKGFFAGFKYECLQYEFDNNDIWIRDYGPIFVEDINGNQKILNFEFNSYGGKFPPWNLDNDIPHKIAKQIKVNCIEFPIILEGGSIEINGGSLLITTEQCLLNTNRNSKLSKSDYEEYFKSLGIDQTIWLKSGLTNDHTDGHIDNIVRFVDSESVIISQTDNSESCQFQILNDAYNQLSLWSDSQGKPLKIHSLPIPTDIRFKDEYLPASYANFIFLNGAVIVPTFNHEYDFQALQILKDLKPNLDVIGIDCNLLIQEGGGLHCISKQQPVFSNS
ncbi:MAG: agmatine deiminase [Planctomycetota bacterium]|nr:MAG: agmatine deiminase [Planctomycetota bacterium]